MKISTCHLLLTLLPISLAAPAQDGHIEPPLPPVQAHYEYWQNQYVQWVNGDLPYSMVELDTGTFSGKPLYLATFTERSTGNRISFTNSASPQSLNATVTQMRFTPPDPDGPGGVAELALLGPNQQPIFWRFVQAVDLTQQGGGLLDMHQVPLPFFYYRDEGAIAGEGTALQVGNTVSPAALWEEVSHPPYFTAYHAARSHDIHIAILSETQAAWKVDSYPTTLVAGAQWTMKDPKNAPCAVRLLSVKGPSVTAALHCDSDPDKEIDIEAERSGAGWFIQRTSYRSLTAVKGGSFNLTFAPGYPEGDAGAAHIRVTAEITGEGKISEGSLTKNDAGYELKFSSPAWLKDKPVALGPIYTPLTANIASGAGH